MLDKSLYWTPHDILTRNAMYNITVGGRGTGKTYGCLNFCINQYIKYDRLFIYLRRYETDLKKKERLLTTVSREFPAHEFRVEGQKLLCRRRGKDKARKWEIMGYVMPLSTANSDKSIPFDSIWWIIYDEFLIGRGNQRYLKNEVEAFQDFYNTVDRYNDRVRVFLIANSTAIVNPYFLYWHISPREGMKLRTYKDGYIAFQWLKSKDFEEQVSNTRFGRMIRDTPYYDYAVSNEFRDNDGTFIAKKSSTAKFHSAYTFDNRTFALWSDIVEGVYYVTSKVPKDAQPFILTRDDMQPNLLMIERSSKLLRGIMRLYMQGSILFDSPESRSIFYDVMEYLNIR